MTVGTDLDANLSSLSARISALESGGSTSPSAVGFTGIKNLRISCPPGATAYTVSFDEAILKNASGGLLKIGASSFIINAASTGLNGVDVGAIQGVDKWYVIHIVSDGVVVGGVLSLSITPTLPAGMTHFALAGAGQCLTSSPLSLLDSIQVDNRVTHQDYGVLRVPGVAAAAGGVYQVLSLARETSPIAKTISGFMGAQYPRDMAMAIAPTGTDIGRFNANGVGTGDFDGFGTTALFSDFQLFTPQTLYWKSVDTVPRNILYLTSFTI